MPLPPPPRARAAGGPRRARRRGLGTAALLLALTLTGCAGADPGHPPSGHAAGHASGAAHGEVGALQHVHGLGVDPGDGALYAATHTGLLRIPPGGKPVRVGTTRRDLMGFTVAGPGRFLASGHPGHGEPGPGNLGLIESTDAGQSWTTRSLAGEADFHALDSAQGVVYGSSGGRLSVSEDGRRWTDRGEQSLADLAVDPADPSRLLITTESGPLISEDGGATFRALPGSPLLLLVAFAPDGGAVGVAPDGRVHTSADGGLTWAPRGNAGGQPQALGLDADTVHVAVHGAIVASADGGDTFTQLYRE